MVKRTDHFYIRATVNNTAAFTQVSIDLGSFVDALGKSVLRIHSISVHPSSQANPGETPSLLANNNNTLSWQLTTQTQTAMVTLNDKSVISMGSSNFATLANAGNQTVSVVGDRVDQTWTDGYLIAVEQIFFGMFGGFAAGWAIANDPELSLILDCTVESMTETSAMALALSQQ